MSTSGPTNGNLSCIVIPTHKVHPSKNEYISLVQLKKILPDFQKYLLVPKKLDVSKYLEIDDTFLTIRFNDKYFASERGYNFLCRTPLFYKPFMQYEYMLIYQLDCFVFKNELENWCKQGFDYVAPPWVEGNWIKEKARFFKMPFLANFLSRVGNGGFSLRKIYKFYKASMLTCFISTRIIFHEDVLWSNIPRLMYPAFKIADFHSALAFGFEEKPEKCLELNNNCLPFGCHAWGKHSPWFWKNIFKNYGYEISLPR